MGLSLGFQESDGVCRESSRPSNLLPGLTRPQLAAKGAYIVFLEGEGAGPRVPGWVLPLGRRGQGVSSLREVGDHTGFSWKD